MWLENFQIIAVNTQAGEALNIFYGINILKTWNVESLRILIEF